MEKCVKMVDGKFNNKCDNTCIRTSQRDPFNMSKEMPCFNLGGIK